MPKYITIKGQQIPKGETVLTKLNVARLPSGTIIDIPVHVFRAKEDGPVLLVMGGMHGDEVNGIEIIRRMTKRKQLQPERGTVIAIPILNVYGFLNFSRDVPDGKDVNRSFPGNQNGSLASRVAFAFMKEVLPNVDFGIDFHTGGSSRSNFPHVRSLLDTEQNLKLAKAFGAPFVLNAAYRPGSFRKEAAKRGKSILVYEAGESLRFDEEGIKEGMNGTLRVMQHLGMIANAPAATEPVILMRNTWVRAKRAGLFRTGIKLGERVKKNQLLGSITDPYGEFEVKLKSPADGFVIGLNHMPVIHQGDALLHIGQA